MAKLKRNKDGSYRHNGIDERFERPTRTRDSGSGLIGESSWRTLAPKDNPVAHDSAGTAVKLTTLEQELMLTGVPIDYLVLRREHPSWPSRPPGFKPRAR